VLNKKVNVQVFNIIYIFSIGLLALRSFSEEVWKSYYQAISF